MEREKQRWRGERRKGGIDRKKEKEGEIQRWKKRGKWITCKGKKREGMESEKQRWRRATHGEEKEGREG